MVVKSAAVPLWLGLGAWESILQEANDDQVPPDLELVPFQGALDSQLSISDDLITALNLC